MKAIGTGLSAALLAGCMTSDRVYKSELPSKAEGIRILAAQDGTMGTALTNGATFHSRPGLSVTQSRADGRTKIADPQNLQLSLNAQGGVTARIGKESYAFAPSDKVSRSDGTGSAYQLTQSTADGSQRKVRISVHPGSIDEWLPNAKS